MLYINYKLGDFMLAKKYQKKITESYEEWEQRMSSMTKEEEIEYIKSFNLPPEEEARELRWANGYTDDLIDGEELLKEFGYKI
jgi:hypothetical protein